MNIDRRSFISTGTTAIGGLAAGCATLPDGGLTIIDTHPHFYDPTRPGGVPWPPKNDEFLYRPIYPSDYKEQATRRPVTGVMVTEASDRVEDNQWILDLAKEDRFIVGLCGNLPLGTPEFAGHLKRFANNKLWLGMRHRRRDQALDPKNAEFIRDVKLLADLGKQLDVLIRPPQLTLVNQLAKAVPDLRIVIDHFANTKIDGKNVDADWTAGIRQVARNRNVFMKVSGLVEGTGKRDGTAPTDVDFYRPWIDIVWEAFGEDRLVYGSNWPVSWRFASLETVQALVYDYFAAKGSGPLKKVFADNARAAYRFVNR